MRAARYHTIDGPIRVEEVADPVCPDDGVVVAVRATGICRSDWHAWHGREPVPLPHIGGHEYAGEVVAVGAGVRRVRVGQRVTVPFVCGCGRCQWCASGHAQICPDQRQPGFDLPGSFAEFVAVPAADTNVIVLDGAIDVAAAAALGCRFATAFRAVTVHGRPQPDQWVAVHGCGGVGLSAIQVARALGARVVAVDIADGALAKAREMGASHVISATDHDVAAAVMDLTGGAHVSIDALGSARTAIDSVLSLRRRGRHVQVGLLLGDDADPPLPMARVIGWELELYGSHGMAAVDYPAMLAMVTDGRLRPGDLITRTVDLDGIGPTLTAMDDPGPVGMTIAIP